MAIPDYELIYDKVADALKGISVAAGYSVDIPSGAVGRRELFLDEIEDESLFPRICVLSAEGGSREEAEIGGGGKYLAHLRIPIMCCIRTDQSTGAIPGTALNMLQNDIQKCLYSAAEAGQLYPGIAIDFRDEIQSSSEPGKDGTVLSFMKYWVTIDYMLPRRGF
jgi:hypothetical protein